MSIKPDFFTFDTLLQKNLFRIPNFQRAYSWESKQRNDLFEDIKKLNKYPDRHHFMATIVCLNTQKKEEVGADEFQVLNVVDGQQRLTTLIIILKSISNILDSENLGEKREKDKIDELLIKSDRRLILIQTNHDSNYIFREYLLTGKYSELLKAETLAERNLIKAFLECDNFVRSWEKGPLDLLKIVKNRIDFIFYIIDDQATVYTTFEVLNSRGLEVDWLDKCKSMLMGIAFEKFSGSSKDEKINELHEKWKKIYRIIGIREIPGHEILRFASTFKHQEQQSKILSAEKSISFLRQYCTKNSDKILDITQYFIDVAKELEILYKNPRLKAVTNIVHARLLAVAILLNKNFTSQHKDRLLQTWEKVSFRIFGLFQKDSRTKVGEYTRLSQKVIKEKSDDDKLYSQIQKLGDEYPIDLAIEEIEKINDANDAYDYFDKHLIYLFYRYEECLAKKDGSDISKEVWEQIWQSSPTDTIEHILPQKPNTIWKNQFGKKYNSFFNRLGNLIILPPKINTKASNKSFNQKLKIYRNNNNLRLISEILSYERWNQKTIKEREKAVLNWIKEEWN